MAVPTVKAGASLLETMEAIDGGACEIALVVDEEGRLLGTVTDGDIRRALLGGRGLSSPVNPVMNRRFTAVGRSAPRTEVLDLMRARTLGQVPIVDEDGRLVGLHLLREILGATPRPNWAIVMAGGRGERLRPLTDSLPKPMVPVAGRPILERIVLHLVGSGIRRVFLAVNYMAEVIEQHFRDGAAFGCEIEYLREDRPLGTGGALTLLPKSPDHPVLALNGDLLTQFDVGALLAWHETHAATATVAVREYRQSIPFGVVDLDGGHVVRLREKPTHAFKINAGIYVLSPGLISRVPSGVEYPMPALLEECLARGERVAAYGLEDEWLDVGNRATLQRARGEES
ncbi:MAG: nucleotidyltransferase family protein [Deltaproteobacteria bacterium]|nr:nucleotidyltransferase family protein [Deltaproteobacteria bacterium]